jgi:hypothetical protein
MHEKLPLVATARGSICSLAVILLFILLGFAGAVFGHGLEVRGEPAQRRELNAPIADFVLTNQDGKRVAFKDLRGKRMVIDFMYTSCPDVCPLLTASLKILREHMTPRSTRLRSYRPTASGTRRICPTGSGLPETCRSSPGCGRILESPSTSGGVGSSATPASRLSQTPRVRCVSFISGLFQTPMPCSRI